MIKQINIRHIANLHNDWLRGLEFYKQEIAILQGRLDEIAYNNTSKEVGEKVEHFQNQFVIHRNFIDDLRHRIHANIKKMESQLYKTEAFVNEDTAVEYENLDDEYLTEEKMFSDLRREFNRFAAEWM